MITLDDVKARMQNFNVIASDNEIQYLIDKNTYWFCNQTGLTEIPTNGMYVMIDKIVAEIIKDNNSGSGASGEIESIKEGDTSIKYATSTSGMSSSIIDSMLNPDLRYWTSGKTWNIKFCDKNWYHYTVKLPFKS
jgi:hypothetical protein